MDKFADIKVGDKVAIPTRSNRYDRGPRVLFAIGTVIRVSAKQFATRLCNVRKSDGLVIGSGGYQTAFLATDELIAEVAQQVAVRQAWMDATIKFNNMMGKLNNEKPSVEKMVELVAAFEKVMA